MGEDARPDIELPMIALLQHGVRWFSDQLTHHLAEQGVNPITPAHVVVLAHLERDAPVSIAELARRAGVTRQTMHRAVTQLVAEGLLTSTPGQGFPRSTLIGLTAAGTRRRDIARRILAEVEHDLVERLGPVMAAHLRTALERAWP